MSSPIRRLAIRMLKRAGFSRENWIIVQDAPNAEPRAVKVKRGGEITDQQDNPIGRNWPKRPPLAAAKRKAAKPKRPARGSRRGKHSPKWISARIAAKAGQ